MTAPTFRIELSLFSQLQRMRCIVDGIRFIKSSCESNAVLSGHCERWVCEPVIPFTTIDAIKSNGITI